MIKHLAFDTAGCAVIRFFSNVWAVSVHWSDAKVSQIKQVCPDSITDDKAVKAKPCGPCLRCQNGEKPAERWVALGWDVDNKEWCIYMAHPFVFERIFKACKSLGITESMMAAGNGPDVVLQRLGKNTEPSVVEESIGEARGDGAVPSLAEELAELRRKSHWLTHATAEALEEKFAKAPPPPAVVTPYADEDEEKLSAAKFEQLAWEPAKKKTPTPPAATPRPPKKKVDPKKLRAEDRWDLME